MTTKPDEELLALWVEDELDVSVHREVDAWASGDAEWVAHRERSRQTKVLLRSVISVDEDLPNGEFFNARIRREIERSRPSEKSEGSGRGQIIRWLVPLTAAASLMLGVMIGRYRPEEGPERLRVVEGNPVLYTPQIGVEAELVGTDEATVIVLDGVDAIPDSWEVPATAMRESEMKSMAWKP
ncbi:MAG: hypothetical protein ACQKBU_00715 [Verrucomicrobiales bacterium]